MKFICDKTILCEAVNNVSPAVSAKSTLMALECILLRCRNGQLSVIGYNLELGITKQLTVQSSENGDIILNARLFGEIINRMPNTELTISTDDKLLTIIKGGGVHFTILGMSADEYPEIPVVSEEHSFRLPAETLRSMISQTLYAVSQDTSTPVLTGTLFEKKGENLYLVSVDGCRLALRKEPVDGAEDFRFVVPGKTLSELLKLTARTDGEEAVQVKVGTKHILFECGGYTVISRLLEGEFIDYRAAIPKEYKTRLTISARMFLESINRASIIISEKIKNPVKAVFENGEALISCETAMGKVSDSIPVQLEGEPVRIGFNNKYMTDALKASELDELVIEINTAFSPIKLLPQEGDHFVFLVMPMRLKDDHETH
ncbi:MAG: DNA polymerase III subunit beta [Candidatus Merdivicinus sp.]|jgi:DNA polymerase-3 subunit beta